MDDAVLQRFALTLAVFGVSVHFTAIANNSQQGLTTVGFLLVLVAVGLASVPFAREVYADVEPHLPEQRDIDDQ